MYTPPIWNKLYRSIHSRVMAKAFAVVGAVGESSGEHQWQCGVGDGAYAALPLHDDGPEGVGVVVGELVGQHDVAGDTQPCDAAGVSVPVTDF